MKNLILSRRRVSLLCLDAVMIAACYYLSFAVRLDTLWPRKLPAVVLPSLPIAVVCVVFGMLIVDVYRSMIRYTSVKDLISMIKGAAVGDVLLLIFIMASYGLKGYPRSVFLLFPVFVVGAFSLTRIGFRLVIEARASGVGVKEKGKAVLIVGAGDAADDLIREMQRNPLAA